MTSAMDQHEVWSCILSNQPAETVPSDESHVAVATSTALVSAGRAGSGRKSNSERGKAFRARRKRYESDLVKLVGSLRKEVVDLDFLHGVRRDLSLRRRHDAEGSLVQLARQYFDVFAAGAPSMLHTGQKRGPAMLADAAKIADKQEGFMRFAMDPEMHFGGLLGWSGLLEQWRRYTAYHSSFKISVTSVEVQGGEENPVVTVYSDLDVRFSRETFKHVFPHVEHNDALIRRFIGRSVTYKGVNRFQFSPTGQIIVYDADVGFVDALLAAGASLFEIALLMNDANITDQCQLGTDLDICSSPEPDNQDDEGNQEDGGDLSSFDARSSGHSRFDVEYLLS